MFDGFLAVDKPLGLTSHDVVARVRRLYQCVTGSKKVGHAGTLDPLASGVLVLCLGKATRLSEYVMHATKRYRAQVTLGVTTTTYDTAGEVVSIVASDHLTRADVEAVLPRFVGQIAQVPPMYSAIKQGGKKLYELARAGATLELVPRTVTINALTMTAWQPPAFELEVVCAAGTYVRSLAHDIGQALGVGAYLSGLVRTQSGTFALADALPLDALDEAGAWLARLVRPRVALSAYPSVTLDAAACQHVRQGRAVLQQSPISDGVVMGYNEVDELQAVLVAAQGWLKPQKVFLP